VIVQSLILKERTNKASILSCHCNVGRVFDFEIKKMPAPKTHRLKMGERSIYGSGSLSPNLVPVNTHYATVHFIEDSIVIGNSTKESLFLDLETLMEHCQNEIAC
jgi:hypothetical protein